MSIEPQIAAAGGIESSTAHQASFSTQGEKEAWHGVAPSEAGHPPPLQYRVSNYALASQVTA